MATRPTDLLFTPRERSPLATPASRPAGEERSFARTLESESRRARPAADADERDATRSTDAAERDDASASDARPADDDDRATTRETDDSTRDDAEDRAASDASVEGASRDDDRAEETTDTEVEIEAPDAQHSPAAAQSVPTDVAIGDASIGADADTGNDDGAEPARPVRVESSPVATTERTGDAVTTGAPDERAAVESPPRETTAPASRGAQVSTAERPVERPAETTAPRAAERAEQTTTTRTDAPTAPRAEAPAAAGNGAPKTAAPAPSAAPTTASVAADAATAPAATTSSGSNTGGETTSDDASGRRFGARTAVATPATARAETVDAAIRLEQAAPPTLGAERAATNAPVTLGSSSELDAITRQTLERAGAPEEAFRQRMVRGLSAMVNQRGGVMTMRLSPPELGALRVQMTIANGAVSAQFFAANEQAHAMLDRSLGTLRTALEGHGLRVERLGVQVTPSMDAGGSTRGETGDSMQRQDADGRQDAAGRESRGRRDGDARGTDQESRQGRRGERPTFRVPAMETAGAESMTMETIR